MSTRDLLADILALEVEATNIFFSIYIISKRYVEFCLPSLYKNRGKCCVDISE